MQVRKQQLELDMEQQTGSKQEKVAHSFTELHKNLYQARSVIHEGDTIDTFPKMDRVTNCTPPDLKRGVAPVGPSAPMQPLLLGYWFRLLTQVEESVGLGTHWATRLTFSTGTADHPVPQIPQEEKSQGCTIFLRKIPDFFSAHGYRYPRASEVGPLYICPQVLPWMLWEIWPPEMCQESQCPGSTWTGASELGWTTHSLQRKLS